MAFGIGDNSYKSKNKVYFLNFSTINDNYYFVDSLCNQKNVLADKNFISLDRQRFVVDTLRIFIKDCCNILGFKLNDTFSIKNSYVDLQPDGINCGVHAIYNGLLILNDPNKISEKWVIYILICRPTNFHANIILLSQIKIS